MILLEAEISEKAGEVRLVQQHEEEAAKKVEDTAMVSEAKPECKAFFQKQFAILRATNTTSPSDAHLFKIKKARKKEEEFGRLRDVRDFLADLYLGLPR
jgi:hypothetical protein